MAAETRLVFEDHLLCFPATTLENVLQIGNMGLTSLGMLYDPKRLRAGGV